tara:strand:- start:677 stop:1102 length:426 start_codon:yes stop_codon:yes gene_type:complete
MKTKLLAICFFLSSSQVFAENICSGEYPNVCDIAKDTQKKFAETLPQKLSKNLLLEKVSSFENTLYIYAKLLYSKKYLEDRVKKADMLMSDINLRMKLSTQNTVCSSKLTRKFIMSGGVVNYIYHFQNGAKYLSINVKQCN